MPATSIDIDNSGGYFYLSLNNYFQNLTLDGAVPQTSAFVLNVSRSFIAGAYITYEIIFDNGAAPWLSLAGSAVSGDRISANNGDKTLMPALGDVSGLQNGTYNADISFHAIGSSESGNIIEMDSTSYRVTLSVVNNSVSGLRFEKRNLVATYGKFDGKMYGDNTIGISNPDKQTVTFNWPFTQSTTGVLDSVILDVAKIAALPVGKYQYTLELRNDAGMVVSTALLTLYVVIDTRFTAQPGNLYFKAYHATGTPLSQAITINNPLAEDFTVQASSWLSAQPSSGSGSGEIIFTADVSALAVGKYTDTIKFLHSGNETNVPVILDVVSFVNFTTGNDAFCLDFPPVVINKINETGRFARLEVSVDQNVRGEIISTKNIYSIPYFQGVAQFDLGAAVQRLVPSVEECFLDISADEELMKQISVSAVVSELDLNYTVLVSETISQKFWPGKKPKGFPLLTDYLHRRKNSGSQIIYSRISGDAVLVGKSSDGVTLYDFPETFRPPALQWENANKVPEWFTFFGDYKFSNEFSHQISRDVFDNKNKKYSSVKTRSVTVETGFITAAELEMIADIVQSRNCFLKIDGKVYQVFSSSTKIITNDSSEELISRSIDFTIIDNDEQ